MIYFKVKRIIDIMLSFLGIFVFCPVWIIIALAIKIDSKGSIFFKQKRIGINKSYFYIYKFRTMKLEAPKECPTHLLQSPDLYITKVGSFLRKTSLDELPQLLNILKGDMSIVGPRPALWNQDDLVKERDKYNANDVRPGLTGWAQINGRDELDIKMKAKLDGYYIKNVNFLFDCKCFIKTIIKIIKQEGIVEGVDNLSVEYTNGTTEEKNLL